MRSLAATRSRTAPKYLRTSVVVMSAIAFSLVYQTYRLFQTCKIDGPLAERLVRRAPVTGLLCAARTLSETGVRYVDGGMARWYHARRRRGLGFGPRPPGPDQRDWPRCGP